MYNKKLLSKIDLGKYSKSDPYKKDIIYDPMGQLKYPGQPTRIPSSNISMKGVNLPVLAVTDNGQKKMMQPGKEYNFPGANYVDEFPQAKKGGSLKSKKYTRSLDGIGSLFVESALFQKPKNNKKRIFHPKAKYYAEGGMPDPGDVTCPDGYEINPKTGRCVLIKGEPGFIKNDVGEWVQDVAGKTVVEDENDERYKDYLIRKHLSDISKIPDFSRRAAVLSDFTNSINNPNEPVDEWSNYYEQYYNPETGYDWTKGGTEDELEDDTNKGMYGSKVQLLNDLTKDQLNKTTAQQLLNDQGFPTQDYFSLGDYKRFDLANYKPDSYLGRASLSGLGGGYFSKALDYGEMRKPIQNSYRYTRPSTSVVEDKINRDRLRKIYPDVTDEDINKAFQDQANSYLSNDLKPDTGRHMWDDLLNYDKLRETKMSNQNDNVFKDFVNSTKKADDMFIRDKHVYYKPEDVRDYIGSDLQILPNYSEPIDKYIVRKTVADADPIVELYTNPDAPEYSANYPTNKPVYDKYNWYSGKNVGMGTKWTLPKRQKNSGGFDWEMSKKVEDIKKYMEGYYDEDGNYIPGEREKAEAEGRQINFQGRTSLKDRAAQKDYNQEWTQYQIEKDAIKQKNIELLQKYNLPTENYLANTKKYGGGLNNFAEGGASGCPKGFYWNGKKCIKIPKGAKVITNPKEYSERKAAYQDSSDLYKSSLEIKRFFPKLPEITKQKYDELTKKYDDLTMWNIDRVGYKEDKKSKIKKPIESYVYSYKKKDQFENPTFIKNNKDIYTNYSDDLEKYQIKLKNGNIKIPGFVYKGKPEFDTMYTILSPNGTYRDYRLNNETNKFDLDTISSPTIEPIHRSYYGSDKLKKDGSIDFSSTGWYGKGKKPNKNELKQWLNHTLDFEYVDTYKKPVQPVVFQEVDKSVLPTTRTVYIDCPPGSVANGQKTDITTPDPDSPGNFLRTITTGCDPIKEKEVIVPIKEPVINTEVTKTEEVPMGTQEYPEELEGPNWEWDRKYHSFTTPRLNKHFPLGPLFNGKKKHTFSTPSLHRRKDYDNGGSISKYNINTEHDLTDAEVARLKKLGYKLEKL